jgi:hypothetical protein
LLKVLIHYNKKVSTKRKRVQTFQTLKTIASHLLIGTKLGSFKGLEKGVHATKFWQLQTNVIFNKRRLNWKVPMKATLLGWQLGFDVVLLYYALEKLNPPYWHINLLTLDVWPKVTWSHRSMVICNLHLLLRRKEKQKGVSRFC